MCLACCTSQKVAAELEAQQTNPIAADALVLDTELERAFDCAQEVKSKQMALTVEQEAREGEEEEAYFASILFQRDQVMRTPTCRCAAVASWITSDARLSLAVPKKT